jgi:hypothetical protein
VHSKVYLNGKKLCLAGIGDDGVLSAIVNWVGEGRWPADLFLHVGGLVTVTQEHVAWVRQKSLGIGDEIRIKIVDESPVDVPIERYRTDSGKDVKARKAYVRAMAKQLGWTIQTVPKKSNPRVGKGEEVRAGTRL